MSGGKLINVTIDGTEIETTKDINFPVNDKSPRVLNMTLGWGLEVKYDEVIIDGFKYKPIKEII